MPTPLYLGLFSEQNYWNHHFLPRYVEPDRLQRLGLQMLDSPHVLLWFAPSVEDAQAFPKGKPIEVRATHICFHKLAVSVGNKRQGRRSPRRVREEEDRELREQIAKLRVAVANERARNSRRAPSVERAALRIQVLGTRARLQSLRESAAAERAELVRAVEELREAARSAEARAEAAEEEAERLRGVAEVADQARAEEVEAQLGPYRTLNEQLMRAVGQLKRELDAVRASHIKELRETRAEHATARQAERAKVQLERTAKEAAEAETEELKRESARLQEGMRQEHARLQEGMRVLTQAHQRRRPDTSARRSRSPPSTRRSPPPSSKREYLERAVPGVSPGETRRGKHMSEHQSQRADDPLPLSSR
eukprot:Hpha_TRINITY_DN10716_c0_g1::TRINITY_DN10716_c0_g1_i2::g.43474::m.43474